MNSSIFSFKGWKQFLCVVSFFLLGELFLRIFYFGPEFLLYPFQYSPKALQRTQFIESSENALVSYRLKSQVEGIFKGAQFSTNDEGYRSMSYGEFSNSDTIKVIVAGRSISMGAGVSDNEVYSYILQELFNQDIDKPVRIINCSVGGYTFIQIAATFKGYIDEVQPKTIILPIYFNELEDELIKKPIALDAYRLNYMYLRSYLVDSFLYYSIRYYLKDLTKKFLPKDWAIRGRNIQKDNNLITNYSVLTSFLGYLQDKNISIIVVSLHRPNEVPEDTWEDERIAIGSLVNKFSNADYIDLVTPLKGKITLDNYIYYSDPHPDSQAHKIYAQYLFPLLKEELQ